MTAPLVQHTDLPRYWETYGAMKGKRDEEKSRAAGRAIYRVPPARELAAKLGCTVRTVINRRNRIVAHGWCSFFERIEKGRTVLFMADNDWIDTMNGYRVDLAIAKTIPKKANGGGYPIVRGGSFMTPDEAMTCQIAHVNFVPVRGAKKPAASNPGDPDVSALGAVLGRFGVREEDMGAGALALLIEARLQVADIGPAELADALAAELDDRARERAKSGRPFSVNVNYIKPFIKNVAGGWARMRKDAARAADAATRSARALESQRLELEYDAFASDAMDGFIASLPAEEYAALIAEATRDLAPLHVLKTKPQIAELVRIEVRRCLFSRVGIPSFEDWRRALFDRRAAAG